MTVLQGSLLDFGVDIGPRPLGTSLQRTFIGEGAWVDVRQGWMAGADVLCERLLGAVPWQAERRRMYDRIVDVPRLLAFYAKDDVLPDPALDMAKLALSEQYSEQLGERFTTAGLCLYRYGRDSVAWHGDTIGRGATEDTMVAIVSLGARRRLLLRPRGGGESLDYNLGEGDLLVMGGSCQRTWEHAVPKTTRSVGPRISIQYRPSGVR